MSTNSDPWAASRAYGAAANAGRAAQASGCRLGQLAAPNPAPASTALLPRLETVAELDAVIAGLPEAMRTDRLVAVLGDWRAALDIHSRAEERVRAAWAAFDQATADCDLEALEEASARLTSAERAAARFPRPEPDLEALHRAAFLDHRPDSPAALMQTPALPPVAEVLYVMDRANFDVWRKGPLASESAAPQPSPADLDAVAARERVTAAVEALRSRPPLAHDEQLRPEHLAAYSDRYRALQELAGDIEQANEVIRRANDERWVRQGGTVNPDRVPMGHWRPHPMVPDGGFGTIRTLPWPSGIVAQVALRGWVSTGLPQLEDLRRRVPA